VTRIFVLSDELACDFGERKRYRRFQAFVGRRAMHALHAGAGAARWGGASEIPAGFFFVSAPEEKRRVQRARGESPAGTPRRPRLHTSIVGIWR